MRYVALVLFICLNALYGSFLYAKSDTKERVVMISTGPTDGIYYPFGVGLCRLINMNSRTTGIHCAVESTNGSIENINNVSSGASTIGIAQVDWLHHAFNGTSLFESVGPDYNLRTIVPLYTESAFILARNDSGINSLDDLRKKRVNIGAESSGVHYTFDAIMKAKNWTNSTFLSTMKYSTQEEIYALCHNKIDAAFIVCGIPSKTIEDALRSCDVKVVSALDASTKDIIEKNYFYTTINSPIETIGIKSILFTSKNTDTELVKYVLSVIMNNLNELKNINPTFSNIEQELKLINQNQTTIPLHDGVLSKDDK
jgi:TRAP transporter TAXI family solute receptor